MSDIGLFCRLAFIILAIPNAVLGSTMGQEVFAKYCSACHSSVSGSIATHAGVAENLARSLTTAELLQVILDGKFDRGGELHGHTIPIMPAWGYLSNDDIAGLANYLSVRSERDARPISSADVVAARRQSLAERPKPEAKTEALEKAKRVYFSKCVACHGTDRRNSVGPPLDYGFMRLRSKNRLIASLYHGTNYGMPGWGAGGQLSAEAIAELMLFLRQPAPEPPAFGFPEILASWELLKPVHKRATDRQISLTAANLFLSLQHDTGQILLIDARHKTVFANIQTNLPPHEIELSANGRYLYVLSRGGYVELVDLYAKRPEIVARARVGYEARSIALSTTGKDDVVVVGSHSPGQVVILDALNLKPLQSYVLGGVGTEVTQVTKLAGAFEFLLTTNSNRLYQFVVPAAKDSRVTISEQPKGFEFVPSTNSRPSSILPGKLDANGRYFLAPTTQAALAVFDTKLKMFKTPIQLPQPAGPSTSVSFLDSDYGPVWAITPTGSNRLDIIATDPKHHPDTAWHIVRSFELPNAGALFMATQSNTKHIWLDAPLSANVKASKMVTAVPKHSSTKPTHQLPIARWAGLEDEPVRVLHPQFNSAGDEVWLTVWNSRDNVSAIVVVNERTLRLKKVITDPRLVTSLRTFSAGTRLKSPR